MALWWLSAVRGSEALEDGEVLQGQLLGLARAGMSAAGRAAAGRLPGGVDLPEHLLRQKGFGETTGC